MARTLNRLNARRVATITKPGRHADGGNLYLNISPSGARSWVFLFRWRGKPKEIGLGPAKDVSLARARELAAAHRARIAEGIEPVGKRRASGGSTFGEVADRVVVTLRPQWRSAKHAAQWTVTLKDHAASLRALPVDKITTEDVLAVLKPLWNDKRETANRMRGRIERVLDAAKASGLRTGENPARWRGHLDQLLPKRQRLEQKHLAAMPYSALPAFMERLREREAIAPLALEFCILTAARTGEVLNARRSEIDLGTGLWTVPATRMKGGREHVVPLSPRAMEVVREAMIIPGSEHVFAGQKPGKPMSGMSLELTLKRMGIMDATVHGFRSSFRDWAGDCTHHQRDVVEAALAHAIENRTEAAYRRSSALEKRRELMRLWAEFCENPLSANVIQFSKHIG
jgi:integrase